jgi:hypothetical protein
LASTRSNCTCPLSSPTLLSSERREFRFFTLVAQDFSFSLREKVSAKLTDEGFQVRQNTFFSVRLEVLDEVGVHDMEMRLYHI